MRDVDDQDAPAAATGSRVARTAPQLERSTPGPPRRLANYVTAAWQLATGPATVAGVVRYAVQKCLRKQGAEISFKNGTVLFAPADLPLIPLVMETWVRGRYATGGGEIETGSTVIDIGANLGTFTLWAATRAANVRIIAVEPSLRMCRCLDENLSRNHIKGVTVLNAACGGEHGEAILYSRGDETRNTLYPKDVFESRFERVGEIPVLTLAEILQRCDVSRCDFLKMDCEGAEYDILLSAPRHLLERIRHIALEYHVGMNDHTPEELERHLVNHGFRVTVTSLIGAEDGYLYATRHA